jgi:Icc protein
MIHSPKPPAERVIEKKKPNGPVVVLQITDMHLHAAADSRMRGVTTYETLLAVIDHVQRDERWPPDAIVVTGDIVQDESRAGYERFRDTLASLGAPVYCLPGNHDDPRLMADVLCQSPFQVCGNSTIGDWKMYFLSSFAKGDDGGSVGPEAIAALNASLSSQASPFALICLHHQPLPMGSAWLDGVGLRDASDFLACIDGHSAVRGVLWGHVHQESDRDRKGVRYMSTPSTCAQFLPNNDSFSLDSRPPGARWIELRADGSIETDVDWLDEES